MSEHPALTGRQEALAEWLREHLLGYMPSSTIHKRCGLYGPDDLAECAGDLAVLAESGTIGDAPGSDGPFGHRWRATEHVPMEVNIRVPVSSLDEDWDAVAMTLRDVIDIPTAEVTYKPWEIGIRVMATGAGMFGGLQAAQEILTVLHDAVRAECANPDCANVMLLRSFLEQAYDVTVQVTGM
ncbi:MAG TPA: hypothetical protein VGO80_06095 [Solirubrobacteraceae bacterium]|jgi:hypothetical protein|nr:hypothetical protein [Solirubrobacteraceae bacterium]